MKSRAVTPLPVAPSLYWQVPRSPVDGLKPTQLLLQQSELTTQDIPGGRFPIEPLAQQTLPAAAPQLPLQQSALPEQLRPYPRQVATHCPFWHVWPLEQLDTHVPLAASHCTHRVLSHGADRQTLPQTLAVGQQDPPRHVWVLEQQVALL